MKEKRYEVISDNQGATFGMYRKYTISEWREQALEWADYDEEEGGLYDTILGVKDEDLIKFIEDTWDLEIVEAKPRTYQYALLIGPEGVLDCFKIFKTRKEAMQFLKENKNCKGDWEESNYEIQQWLDKEELFEDGTYQFVKTVLKRRVK